MSLVIESMSLRRGTPLSVVFPSAIRHAAMIGSALFLLPLISILPLSRCPAANEEAVHLSPSLGRLPNRDGRRRPLSNPFNPCPKCPGAGRCNGSSASQHPVYRPLHRPIFNLSCMAEKLRLIGRSTSPPQVGQGQPRAGILPRSRGKCKAYDGRSCVVRGISETKRIKRYRLTLSA